jgi:hypothetical protein
MIGALTHPTLVTSSARSGLALVVCVRALLAAVLVITLDALIGLGTAPMALVLGATIGVTVGSLVAFTRLRTLGFLGLIAGTWACFILGARAIRTLVAFTAPGNLGFYNVETHLALIVGCAIVGALSSWVFWRSRHAVTLELVALAAFAIYLFSGHRNFRFDTPANTPQIINSLAWFLGTDHLTILVSIGGLLAVLLFAYGFAAQIPSKPSPELGLIRTHPGAPRTVASATVGLFLAATLAVVGGSVYQHYALLARDRTMNGVGMNTSEGLSPLSFQSALGSTNQPAGLVRLEGDYATNPFSPMLFLRESALSQFSGREFVQASRNFDRDVNMTSPRESFVVEENTALPRRQPIGQSVYLLADHTLAFALDYPLSIAPLSLPGNKRFRAAYRVHSLAPAFNLADLRDGVVGDPQWSTETREHYLRRHPDPRYTQLALEISAHAIMPVEKAAAITQFLTQTAIYTLTPNHAVAANEDPVAPFLFGDRRGYCVHFAHAVAYMLRALDIPARVSTGYLTDLSQAKDGHILLRMSDRHAWAEAYIDGAGWVPFDVQPEQVESHGDSQVDMKLLEELMASLEPGEEILPKDIAKDEPQMEEPSILAGLGLHTGAKALLLFVLLALVMKVYIRLGWLLPSAPERTLVRAARATLSSLHDLGLRRRRGETRLEFAARMKAALGFEPFGLTPTLTDYTYAAAPHLDRAAVLALHRHDRATLRRLPLGRRILGVLNPSSVLATLTGKRW